MSVWKSIASQFGGLAKHAAKSAAAEPLEVVKDALGQRLEQAAPSATQTGGQGQPTADLMADLAKTGFKTPEDFARYQALSGQKDQLETEMLRKQLVREWGLDTDLGSGMQKARMEYEQREEERKKVEEKQEEEKKEFEFQQKKQEDIALQAAKSEASAENKAWGAG